jgi:hypothetical protein
MCGLPTNQPMSTATFIKAHPICAFCGGGTPSTTVEHCPPRSMFQNQQWPEGFEFPACDGCNAGTRDDDLLIALLGRLDPVHNRGELDGRMTGLMKRAHKRNPGMFAKMLSVGDDGQPLANVEEWNITDEMRQAVDVLAAKLTKGIYYLHTGAIFPNDGGLVMTWFTNADVLHDGGYKLFDSLQHIVGDAPSLTRARKVLNDQFEYKFSLSPEKHILALQTKFGNAFGFVVFGSTTSGLLEKYINQAIAAGPRADGVEPFRIIQSTSLPLGRLQSSNGAAAR